MKTTKKIYCAAAFAREAFSGNPAAVCLLDKEEPAEWMQSAASEMNLSETAFVQPLGGVRHRLRWFTPTMEVPLCGHATLASAHILFSEKIVLDRVIEFETQSGVLRCEQTDDGKYRMDFPRATVKPKALDLESVEAIIGARPVAVFEGQGAEKSLIVEVDDFETLRAIAPDLRSITASPWGDLFIVTCEGNREPYHFQSRVFAPKCGIPEDPVTGSAHCHLAPYWEKRLGVTSFHARQASRRGGVLELELTPERVTIAGECVTTLAGELRC